LERQEFLLHYQPKISLRTGAITGAEALIRCGILPADSSRLLSSFPSRKNAASSADRDWVLHEASRRLGHGCMQPACSHYGVNVSAMQLRDGNFLEGVFAVLKDTGLDGRSLDLELTESVLMNHAESTASILRALREAGIRVTIDDFGTGYSSLSYLRRFPIDAIKIDRLSSVRSPAPGMMRPL